MGQQLSLSSSIGGGERERERERERTGVVGGEEEKNEMERK